MSKTSLVFGNLIPLFLVVAIIWGIIAMIIFSYKDWRECHQDAPFAEYFPGSSVQ
jgi:hypothetical protein